MKWEMVEDAEALAQRAASHLLDAIGRDPGLVLGLPTGRTPEGMYRRVTALCNARARCFDRIQTFNLDEYVGLAAEHPGSYRSYMRRMLFDPAGIPQQNTHIPDGTAGSILDREPGLDFEEALRRECLHYEAQIREAGGIHLCFLGLGTNGHIGFNEPGASFRSRTRVVELQPSTRQANSGLFEDGIVPDRAITMGIGTILESDAIVLLVSGAAKAEAVQRLTEGPITEDFPASILRTHPDVTWIVDRAAATRIRDL